MIEVPHGFVQGSVTDRIDWTENEFSLMINAPIEPYIAGQFTKLGLLNDSGEWVRRAYSLVNSPHHKAGHQQMEFLFITADEGELSPRLQLLKKGDPVYVAKTPSGFMTLAEIPDNMSDLWLLSTGSAIGPFLSILDELETASRFEEIVLVHAVRTEAELVYQSKIAQMIDRYKGKLRYIPIVSREQCDGILQGRIPDLLLSGVLTETAQVALKEENSFFYICGNPDMVKDTSNALNKLGYSKNLRRKAGNFSSENYW
ncbi:MAG: ferredoxin--NADP+ reductase [Psychromonas sp.]|jgi:ferredoxin--NADP+ reductase|uniref:ferredoxin--NADP reductase n=1 Tax=Psychromonas sp. TaxID=1884585 RepID=UPI0039E6900A